MPASSDTASAVDAPAALSPRSQATFWKRVTGPLYVTGIFWFRVIAFSCRGPDWFVRTMVACWSALFCTLLRRHRAVLTANLAPVLGPCSFWQRQTRLLRIFHNHAWCLVERFQQFTPGFAIAIDFEGETWQRLRASERGFILFTAHIGNWEMGAQPDLGTATRRLHIVREPEEFARTQGELEAMLARHPNRHVVTHFLRDEAELGIELMHALRRGDAVALAGDRARAGMTTLSAEMFGRRVQLPAGPAALARAAGVPLVPAFLFRTGLRRYRFVAREPFDVARSGDRARDLAAAAARIGAEIEWAIREEPLQWKRWETVWSTS